MTSDHEVLRSSRLKWSMVLVTCLAFVLIGAVTGGGGWVAWAAVGFFGLGAVVALAAILWPSRLELDDRGMTLVHLGRRTRFEFEDCGAFRTWSNPVARQHLVTFDWAKAAESRVRGVNHRLGAESAALPDTFGMSAEALAHLLNDRRARV